MMKAIKSKARGERGIKRGSGERRGKEKEG